MKKLLLIFSIVSIVVSCQALAQKQDTPETVFNVPLTKTSTHDGVSITLVAVVEDSRCPRDTTCIWAGKAVVKILVRASGEDAQEITVVFQNESQSVIATTEDTVFTALKLIPYPGDSYGKEIGYQLQVSKKGIKF
ncbi:hypothetical protein N9R16_01540 [Flavobacteriaceae bacterium]|nr:hypothetical protein [Flavobacteriaceae bacterium]MDA9372722.1 hypothetical protein [Flavobacteriaceae bacterium]